MDQIYIALSFLVVTAVSVVVVAAYRFRSSLKRGKIEESLQTGDALIMPISGSVFLFTLYVLLRFIPRSYFNVMISFYLSVMSIFALATFIKPYIKPSILTGLFCITTAGYYFWTRNWVANDILAFAMGVVALESVPLGNFQTAFILLIGLFFYDIFWVFGSDVMLTVATGIDGPIKFVFPQTLIGNHDRKSLLGLGDVIVPGFFIVQTLVFSRDAVKRGNLYFNVALVAYFLSLINTMVVMLVFKHGQPALLFIVPWLLISFTVTVLWNGDFRAAWSFDTLTVFSPKPEEGSGGEAKVAASKQTPDVEAAKEESISGFIREAMLELFGLGSAEDAAKTKAAETSPKSEEKKDS